ncbi:MAG: ATP-binding response regulator [Anaerolineae bacterium]
MVADESAYWSKLSENKLRDSETRRDAREITHLILIADDDPYLRSILRRMLEGQGHRVEEAVNGAQCIEAFEQLKPDVILLDVMMPVMDGFTACARLRQLPGGDRVPIVMISVLDDHQSVARAFEVGATDYMTKPLNVQILLNRLHYMLSAMRTERLISRAKKEWEATFDAVSDLIALTDLNGSIVRCNRATVERLGVTFVDILGRPIQEILLRDLKPHEIGTAISGRELELPSLGGYFFISVYPIHVQDSLDGLVYVMRDITERKQMEMHILASQKLADLGTLAAGIAHEINSPLQVITGVSQALLDRHASGILDAERLQKGLVTIHRSGWRCAEIVRALRTYAHAAATELVATNLNEVVRDTLLLVENQLRSWDNIKVVTELNENLPTLHCDRNQIAQLLINLLTNARDAMPHGGTIVICTGYDPARRSILLSVSDTGGGIPEAIRDRIFDPFFTTKPPGQGTGLGLSIVAGIVRAHHGEISLQTGEGKGTTFTIVLPQEHSDLVRSSEPGIISSDSGAQS